MITAFILCPQMEDEMDMEDQLEREMAAEEEEQLVQMALDHEYANQNPLCKEFSLPADFTFKSLPPSPLYQSNNKPTPTGRKMNTT